MITTRFTRMFGLDYPLMSAPMAMHSGGRLAAAVSKAGAREAVAAGPDIRVAQGNEAGGHPGTMNPLPLLVSVLDAFPDIPVLASGGIASGRALAAVLAAGADGAWAGTAFLATPECVEIPEEHKQAIIDSDGEDTIYTRVYDVLWRAPWPPGIAERGRRNRFTDEWDGRDQEIIERRQEIQARVLAAANNFDPAGDRAVLYGQSAGAVPAIRPAAEVVRTICEDAERLLQDRTRDLLKS